VPQVISRSAEHRDFGSYEGEGLGGTHRVVAYRVSRTRPVMTVVEQPLEQALTAWRAMARQIGLLACAAAAAVLAMSQLAARSLRAREAARSRLERARRMNDHVAKPVDPERLYTALARWRPVAVSMPRAGAPARIDDAPLALPLLDRLAGVDGLDVDRAMRLTAGHPQLLRRVREAFVEFYREAPPALDAMRAHSLRGACASIGAVHLASGLLDFERDLEREAGQHRMQERSLALLDELHTLVCRLGEELAAT